MPANANIKAVITADDRASAVIKKFGHSVDTTGKNVSKSLDASFFAAAAATAGVVAFGKKSLDAFNQSELATARLRAGIENVVSATDKNVDSLLEQARALQKTTRFSDEAYVSAQGILTTFQLNQKAIEKLTPRLADMSEGLARVTGGMPDLESNAILVAKAIGGEDVTGLSGALRRVGVIMTDAQQKMLQTGTVEERVALVTQILDQNFKGLAVSAGDTTAGKISQLGNNFNDLQEKVGSLLANALNPLLDNLNKHPAILATLTVALGGLAAAFVAVKVAAAIGTVLDATSLAMARLSASTNLATGSLVSLSAVSLSAWGAGVIFIAQRVAKSMRDTTDAINNTKNAMASADVSDTLAIQKLQKLATAARQRGDQAEANRIANVIRSMTGFASGGFTGIGASNEVAGVVHKGEFVVPKPMVDQNTGMPKPIGGNTTYNFNVNVGMYAGTEMEKRKIAQELMRAWQDTRGYAT